MYVNWYWVSFGFTVLNITSINRSEFDMGQPSWKVNTSTNVFLILKQINFRKNLCLGQHFLVSLPSATFLVLHTRPKENLLMVSFVYFSRVRSQIGS